MSYLLMTIISRGGLAVVDIEVSCIRDQRRKWFRKSGRKRASDEGECV